MADSWEVANRLDPRRNDAWGDANRNGWPNLDEFLHFAHLTLLEGNRIR
jgi:hypothetical protein